MGRVVLYLDYGMHNVLNYNPLSTEKLKDITHGIVQLQAGYHRSLSDLRDAPVTKTWNVTTCQSCYTFKVDVLDEVYRHRQCASSNSWHRGC